MVKELKKATSGIDNKSYPVLTLLDSIHTLFSMKQSEAEPNDRYLERFKSNVNTIELAHGEYIFCPTSFVKPVDPDNITAAEKKIECEKMKAALLLRNSDHKRYGALSLRLREGVTLGRNEYPETLSSMYELMVRQRQNNNNNNNRNSISLLQYNNNSNRNKGNSKTSDTNGINDTTETVADKENVTITSRRRGFDTLQFGCMLTQMQW